MTRRQPSINQPSALLDQVFNVYVSPILTYAIPIWLPGMTASAEKTLNSLFTKFLKRYFRDGKNHDFFTNNQKIVIFLIIIDFFDYNRFFRFFPPTPKEKRGGGVGVRLHWHDYHGPWHRKHILY